MEMKNSRLVYSTGTLPDHDTELKTVVPVDEQKITLHLDRKGGGKTITVVRGIQNSSKQLSLAKELKKSFGVGGSIKNEDILIQGNHREKIKEILSLKGYNVKLSGG